MRDARARRHRVDSTTRKPWPGAYAPWGASRAPVADAGPGTPPATQDVRGEKNYCDRTIDCEGLIRISGPGAVCNAKASQRELVRDHELPDACVMAGAVGKQDEEPGEQGEAEQAPGLDDRVAASASVTVLIAPTAATPAPTVTSMRRTGRGGRAGRGSGRSGGRRGVIE